MNDKRRKYGAVVSVSRELLDRYPTHIPRIEEELVYRLTDPIIKEAAKGECIVRFTETRQREGFTTGLIEFYKSVCVEEIVRCKDCKWWVPARCAGEPKVGRCKDKCASERSDGYCSHGERRTEAVEKMESIGFVRERHGTWSDDFQEIPDESPKKMGMSYYCSACGHRAGKYKHKTYRYCPWCGARMDGE